MENSEPAAQPDVTPGQRLQEAREAAGMSPRETADRLNWLPSYVTAIEENRFDQLRGSAFVRGYLRAYARAVELDEDEIVDLYLALHPDAAGPATQNASAPPSNAPSQKTGFAVVLGVAVAAVVIGAIWWKQGQPEGAASKATPAATATPATSGSAVTESGEQPAVDEPVETADAGLQPGAAELPLETSGVPGDYESPATEPPPAQDSEPEVAAERRVDAQEPETERVVAEAVTVDAAEVDSGMADGPLQFTFSGDCWLEVRDGEGQLIYADLKRAGETLGLDGVPPFQILAGDAAAVSLRYQGESVPILTRPGRDTARFTIGEP